MRNAHALGERDLGQCGVHTQAAACVIRIERVVDRRERCVARIDDAEGDQRSTEDVIDLVRVDATLDERLAEGLAIGVLLAARVLVVRLIPSIKTEAPRGAGVAARGASAPKEQLHRSL